MSANAPAQTQPWYLALNRNQWNVLLASNLGWLLDGYEIYALILTIGLALHQLLEPALYPQIPAYAGWVIGLTLLGWGFGGLIGGILADYIGRKRTMILAILAYSLMTGLSAFAWSWMSFAALRFLVGIAIGSEWATGSAMMAELWPDRTRGKGAGLMQCGLGIGFFLASFVWLFVGTMGADAWRYMYLIGILPGLATLWIRRAIPESKRWEETKARRQTALARKKTGAALADHELSLARFTLADVFATPELRRRTIIALLMSFATTFGWWGISSWVPPYIASVAAKSGLAGPQWASFAGMAYNVGAILGYIGLGFLADRFGRKSVAIAFYAMAFVMTPVLFLWTHDLQLLLLAAGITGLFSLGQFAWMPVWLPELYPTRLRGTGIALCFNAPRLVAWLAPIFAGALIAQFGGFGRAATTVAFIYIVGIAAAPFLPETRGKPLPETI